MAATPLHRYAEFHQCVLGGWIMDDYEIRITREKGGPIHYMGPQLNDQSAVRQATLLSREQDSVEVWRDLTCLFMRKAKAAA
jgi:hypothetical protein